MNQNVHLIVGDMMHDDDILTLAWLCLQSLQPSKPCFVFDENDDDDCRQLTITVIITSNTETRYMRYFYSISLSFQVELRVKYIHTSIWMEYPTK